MPFISYAQNFEDRRLWRALSHVERGRYLDIGAQHPVMDSVSKAFYDAGWRGAHVEPTTTYAAELRSQRPDELIFEVAVGRSAKPMTFYEFPETGMSTGKAEIARMHNEQGFEVRMRRVPVVPLSKLLSDFRADAIHWMKIDVEGMEHEVLRSWGDSPARPWILAIESVHPSSHQPTEAEWLKLVLERGYREVAFDALSRFFVSEEHIDLAPALELPPNIFDDFRITRYHFSAQQVAAEYQSSIDQLEARLGEATAALAGGDHVQELNETKAALEQQQARSQLVAEQLEQERFRSNSVAEQLEDERAKCQSLIDRLDRASEERNRTSEELDRTSEERNRTSEELKAARTEFSEEESARVALETRLEEMAAQMDIRSQELAAISAERAASEARLRAAESEIAQSAVIHAQVVSRSRQLHRTLLSDYAAVRRSRDELEKIVEQLRSERDPAESAALEARIVALEQQVSNGGTPASSKSNDDLTSAHEVVEAVTQEAEGVATATDVATNSSADSEIAPMTLDELLQYQEEQFVVHAYRLLLRRQPDPEGLRHYTAQARRRGGKVRVLSDLARSSEARKVDAQIPGLQQAIRGQRLRNLVRIKPIDWFLGRPPENDVVLRLRSIEERLVSLTTPPSFAAQPAPPPAPLPEVTPQPAAPAPSIYPPHVVGPQPEIIKLDADRMVSADQWRQVTEGIFRQQWPGHSARIAEMKVDSSRQLWIVVSGEASDPVPPQTIANLRSLRDAAPFDIEFGSLGPKMPLGSKLFNSLGELCRAVPSDGLILFIGRTDQVDGNLPVAILLDRAWDRDFVLTDQAYAYQDRMAYVPFHGIDHYHLQHADYFWSRFMVSAKGLNNAVDSGAQSLADVSRHLLRRLKGKNGKRLHLQYPFIQNGELDLETVRRQRHAVMRDLAANSPPSKKNWQASVSVIVSTKDGGYLLDGLVQHLLGMPQIAEVLVVSNNTTGDYTLDLLDKLSQTERCMVFKYDEPFNFSIQCNLAARAAKGKFLLIFNDDISLIGSTWLDYLLADVDDEQPRIAGPLMLYPNQSIQCGGMYLGHNNRAGHTFRHQKHPHDAPMYELVAPRLTSCLTGACMLLKRSLYEQLNGLDEQLATGLQDVDLSLRALYGGAEIVFDPRSIIFHLESISIIPTLADEQVTRRREREYARFRDRWDTELRPDHWHNRNFYIEDESLRSIKIGD